MKILHTSDWHIGKRLGRHDRMDEFVEVLAEVERIADEREVDLVIVSGDVWDRPAPATDALALGLPNADAAGHAPARGRRGREPRLTGVLRGARAAPAIRSGCI